MPRLRLEENMDLCFPELTTIFAGIRGNIDEILDTFQHWFYNFHQIQLDLGIAWLVQKMLVKRVGLRRN